MKKYVITIIVIGILLGVFLIYNGIKVNNESTKIFTESGYILQIGENNNLQSVERYYFNADSKYKEKYNEKIVFQDTDGETIKVNYDNFVHYSNGSASAFQNGVLLNFEEIDEEPILYYNIKAGSVINKKGDSYTITNLDKELNFKKLLWKISPQKYIIMGNQINLVFDDGTNKIINGYIEIEYLDNEIVKIYNQEVTYQTISSKVYIEIEDGIKLNLANKIVSKDGENKMSLENMIIDSDDNVTIVDLSAEENKENTNEIDNQNDINDINNINDTNAIENQITENPSEDENIIDFNFANISGGSNTNNSENNINNNQNTIINNNGNSNIDNNEDNEAIDGDDDDENNNTAIAIPVYKVNEFNVDSIGVDATITIEDEKNLLTEDTTIKIVKNSTGKTAYEIVEPLGNYNIDIFVATLEPDTEYTLIAESTYEIDGIKYTRDFLSKIFRTTPIGISIEKDVFTDTTMQFVVNMEKNTQVKSAEVILSDIDGNKISSYTVTNEKQATKEANKTAVLFTGLTSNTSYQVSIANVLYNTQIITNGFELKRTYTTLKAKPSISGTEFEINKRDGYFKLRIKNKTDTDQAIESYRFEIFDTRMLEKSDDENIDLASIEPVTTIDSTIAEITLPIDNVKISRNVGYAFRVVAIGNDNEKIREYESEYSEVFKMDGNEFPTVKFEQTNITYERIEGKLIIEDKGETIHLTDDTKFTVTYKDSVGTIRSFTSQGSLIIPVSVNNLRANETYQFAVYTTIDLNDGNPPIEECYIGGALVKTGLPNNMVATFRNNNSGGKNAFKVSFRLQNEKQDQGTLEPETLTGMEISIYAGQTVDGNLPTGTPLRTIRLVDTNTEPYESELKTNYYDRSIDITPEFFNAENGDFRDKYYTITVTGAYDYTDYQNSLPILQNVYSIKTEGFMPDLPTDPNNAVVVTAIRNRDVTNPREDLEPATVVGYKVKAVYDNKDLYAKKVIYKVYDSNTNTLIQTIEQEIGEDGVIPTVTFNVEDGTPITVTDNDALRRGNSYYFTYEMILDLDGDGQEDTKYPYEDEGIVLRSTEQTPTKQQPLFIMYPSTSNANTMTVKYKCSDVDNAIVNDNKFQIKIGKAIVDQKLIDITGVNDEYSTVQFENLTKGDLEVDILQNTIKNETTEERILIKHKFDGLNSINNVKYRVSTDPNKLLITLEDSDGQLGNVAAAKVKIVSTDGSVTVEKDLTQIPDNNIIGINYNDLGELVKKQARVEVYVYYDTGITGYDIEEGHYVAYKRAQAIDENQQYYYGIEAKGNFVESTSIRDNIYDISMEDNEVSINNPINGRNTNIELAYTENGFKYEGNVILQRRIDLEQVQCIGNNVISLDLIIPGISLKDENDEWTIQTELDNMSMKVDLVVEESTIIKDNKIYIDIYETDQNGSEGTLVKTEERLISEFANVIKIDDLTPRKYYYMKFRTFIDTDDGQTVEKDLYDLDYQVTGKLYYFSTLADVGITDIQVNYQAVKYDEKYIDVVYNLEKITGYTRIEYNVYHYNTETSTYELYTKAEPDVVLKKQMEKKIPINPGSNFKFGDKYKVEIVPISEYHPLDRPQEIQELELGKKEKEFTFTNLQEPIIAVRGTRLEDNKIRFRVTIYDYDKVIENNKYKVQILDEYQQDITPEEYKKEFETNSTNYAFDIENTELTKKYKIIVIAKVDYDNDAIDLEEYRKEYEVLPVNEDGISVGEITPTQNLDDSSKIDLIFNNSYRIDDIQKIRYSIYNTNGYAQNGEEDFIPSQYVITDDTGITTDSYYVYTLQYNLSTYGSYNIELQFLKDDEVVAYQSVEYIYREQ